MENKNDLGADAAVVADAGSIVSDAAIARHTPGPWAVTSDFVGPLRITTENRETVALVGDQDSRKAIANAELISASPDLYAALKAMTPICDAMNELIDSDEDLRARVMVLLIKHGLRDDAFLAAANSLAKAEGR